MSKSNHPFYEWMPRPIGITRVAADVCPAHIFWRCLPVQHRRDDWRVRREKRRHTACKLLYQHRYVPVPSVHGALPASQAH